MIRKISLVSGAVFGFLSVAFGAFGAHALKPFLLERNRLDTFDLAVEYQFYHALALLVTGLFMSTLNSHRFKYAGICFFLGIFFFSGSLYGLCFSGLGILGILTPIGGVLFLIGWAFLAVGLMENKKAS